MNYYIVACFVLAKCVGSVVIGYADNGDDDDVCVFSACPVWCLIITFLKVFEQLIKFIILLICS